MIWPVVDLDATGGGRSAYVESMPATGAAPQAPPSLLYDLVFEVPGTTGGGVTSSPDWLCIGTSPSVEYRRRPSVRSRVGVGRAPAEPARTAASPAILSLSVPEQLQEAQAALSLNRSQLAQMLGVSRPTLYEWLEGNSPSASNTSRLSALLQLLQAAGIKAAAPLNARFVRQPLGLERPALIELLSQEPLDSQAVLSALAEARRLGDEAVQAREAREERLRTLGYDEVTEQQRREQLATTVSLLTPPK
jgi:transcriptional regulator with XRE-family HTH domain